MTIPALAQQTYTIDVPRRDDAVRRGHLDLGGQGANGDTIAVNNQFIEWNGQPFIPIVGEFHYVRYPAAHWEESLRKIKAGGINVVATYVFWNVHERREGEFDWSGDLDLRAFIAASARVGLHVIVRLGPFCHGEIRNGGIPDWVYGRDFEVRSNDPGYLQLVDRLYGEIAAQIRDAQFSQGGPVIGVQLENEYQHSAAPWEITYPGSPREYTVAERDLGVTHVQVTASERQNAFAAEGRAHMAVLKKIAKQHGIDVPLYTATGWGNAAIVEDGSIPVTAAYAYPFWAPPEPSPFYLYKDLRRQPDYAPVSYDPEKYPSMPAEIGPGIMPTYARRPRVDPGSVEPLIVRTLGSGSNGIGYYMYHGGSTPTFGRFFSEEAGGLPKINYDFQAPIGEFGQLRPHFHSLKLLHLFLESQGATLAPMLTTLPATNAAITARDTSTLRYAVRASADGSSGFLFMHNFQDHLVTPDLADLKVTVRTSETEISFPSRDTFALPSGSSAILPFNLDLGGVVLRSATVQPLTVLRDNGTSYHVFFSIPGLPPELVFAGTPRIVDPDAELEVRDGATRVHAGNGKVFSFAIGSRHFLVIPREMALRAWKDGVGRLWFSEATILPEGGEFRVLAGEREVVEVSVYPAQPARPRATGAVVEPAPPRHRSMSTFRLRFPVESLPFVAEAIGPRKYRVRTTGSWDTFADTFMKVDYVGDRCMAFFNGELVADHFYQGEPWEVGLRKFRDRLATQEMILVFHPVHRDHAFLNDLDPVMRPKFAESEKTLLRVNGITFAGQHSATLSLGE